MGNWIYLDNAATMPTHPAVIEKMLPYFGEKYGNPAGFSAFADEAKSAIENAREEVASLIGAKAKEIYFTSGGTESDNWAIIGTAIANTKKGRHIITSKIEHHAVLKTYEYLEKHGFEVTYLNVDKNGIVDLNELRDAIRPDTILISIMFANNEIGTIEPIKDIGSIAHENKIIFHTDAVQAYGHVPIDVEDMNIDLLSASAHKIGGPKGIGMLYIRRGIKIDAYMHGGEQEKGKRAGTSNTASIVGFGAAAVIMRDSMAERIPKECALRDYFIALIEEKIPYCRLNGDRTRRLPHNANISFQYIEGESMLIMLDQNGICASSGSACTSGSLDPSHVLLAIGLPHETAHGSLRITLTANNTREEIEFVVDKLVDIVAHLREMSPLYADFIREQQNLPI